MSSNKKIQRNEEKEILKKKKRDAIKKYSFEDVLYTPKRDNVLSVGGIKYSNLDCDTKIAFLR